MEVDVLTQVWGVLLGIGSETYTKHWKFIGTGIAFWEVNTQLTTDTLTLHCWHVPALACGSDVPDCKPCTCVMHLLAVQVFTCDQLKHAVCIVSLP